MRVERGGDPGGPTRRLAVASLGLLLVATACASGTGSSSGGGGAVPAQPLAPFTGTLAPVALPAGIQSLHAVACPSAARCWAVGSTLWTARAPSTATVVTSSTGGATWTVQRTAAAVGYLTAIDCPTVRVCSAVGQVGAAGPGAILSTRDAGGTWTLEAVPAGTTDVTAVACPTATACTALADVSGLVTTLTAGTAGGPWVVGGALPATVASATGLSCTDARDCWATVSSPVDVGHAAGSIAATADGGATWGLEAVPAGTGALEGIDCVVPPADGSTTTSSAGGPRADCTAVGTTATATAATRTGQGLVLTTSSGGATWSTASVTAASAALLAVSCGAGPCVAVGTTPTPAARAGVVVLAASTGPTGWRRAAVASVALPLTGVSCLTLASCVVVGESISAHLTAG